MVKAIRLRDNAENEDETLYHALGCETLTACGFVDVLYEVVEVKKITCNQCLREIKYYKSLRKGKDY